MKNKSMLMSQLILLCAVTLSGCAILSPTEEKQQEAQTPVDRSLMDAARSVEQMANQLRLAQNDPPPAPYTGFPLPSDANAQVAVSPASGPLASQVALSWDGQAGPAIKAVAQYIGWKYQEEGTPGDRVALVSVHQDAGSVFGVFQNIGRQLGRGVTVIVDDANSRIVLHYGAAA